MNNRALEYWGSFYPLCVDYIFIRDKVWHGIKKPRPYMVEFDFGECDYTHEEKLIGANWIWQRRNWLKRGMERWGS